MQHGSQRKLHRFVILAVRRNSVKVCLLVRARRYIAYLIIGARLEQISRAYVEMEVEWSRLRQAQFKETCCAVRARGRLEDSRGRIGVACIGIMIAFEMRPSAAGVFSFTDELLGS